MTFDNAKQHLQDEYIKEVESGEESWEMETDPVKKILDYLGFAYGKVEDERSLSAERSIYHMLAWVWLTGDDKFFKEIESEADHYTDYGKAILDKIANKYGYKQ